MPADDDFGAFVPGARVVREALTSGPLAGLRFAAKDLFDVEGEVTGGGNPDWARTHGPAAADAWAVRALREVGAALAGKTVTDELAFSLEGENAHHGTPRNPRAPQRLPGGSSSGSAVAVAAGLVDFALGTDTGGSVRIPAAFCGAWGFRPTHGRVPLAGVLPFAPSYDTVGWIAPSAALLQRVGHVLLGTSPADAAPLAPRIARDVFALADTEAADPLLPHAQALTAGTPVDAFGGADPQDWLQAYELLQGIEIRRSLGDWIAATRPRFGANIAPRFEGLARIDLALVPRWQSWRAREAERIASALGTGGAWLLPTAPCAALPLDATPAARDDFYRRALAVNALAGHAGLPQLTMPLARSDDGAPLGLSLIGPRGSDERLLALAVRIDETVNA